MRIKPGGGREGEHDRNERMHRVCICIPEGAEAPRLCRGSRRIELWETKEKERVQIYQLLGGEDGGFGNAIGEVKR